MNKIHVQRFGQIEEGSISFGDLTFFVGPQASGKSLLLQLMKLLIDGKHIRKILTQYGYNWSDKGKDALELYFGEGMGTVWKRAATKISMDGKELTYKSITQQYRKIEKAEEKLYYIPAQRVLCLSQGWPRFFSDYDAGAPYVLKHFSETLRRFMESLQAGKGQGSTIFPLTNRLKNSLRESITNSIFHNAEVAIEKKQKKRMMLNIDGSLIPYLGWSAGQREFMPLLMSLYLLCPPSKVPRKDALEYVVIEEPEMGMHPNAIQTILLLSFELLRRGYKVIISTHSTVPLEMAWTVQNLKKNNSNAEALFPLFGLDKKNAELIKLFDTLLTEKTIRSYYFEQVANKTRIKDISSLDAGDEDNAIANWGGISDFASRSIEVVAGSVQ